MPEEAKWYVVHTYSGYENKVASNLEKTVENRHIQDLIQEIRVPTEIVTEIKDNKKREVERKIFPGYVLVKMVLTDESWYVVRNIRGCTGFVGPSSKPIPLSDEEIARLGVKMGGKFESFCGLTGIGDLIVTCASVHSRNRKAGYLMGQGKSMEEAMKEVNMVVEGVYSAKAAAKLAQKYEVPMPIVDEVNKVLFEGKDPKQAVDDLMLRESKIENSSLLWEE